MKKSPSEDPFIECVRVYTDGACRCNPGPSSIGVVLYDDIGNELERFSRAVGTSTANAAEYEALIRGLDSAAKFTRRGVECYLDSDVVEGQLAGRYRLRSDRLRRLFHRVKDLERPFSEVSYIRVRENDQRHALAHKLAHDALNGR
jgi:ribonuclease HI